MFFINLLTNTHCHMVGLQFMALYQTLFSQSLPTLSKSQFMLLCFLFSILLSIKQNKEKYTQTLHLISLCYVCAHSRMHVSEHAYLRFFFFFTSKRFVDFTLSVDINIIFWCWHALFPSALQTKPHCLHPTPTTWVKREEKKKERERKKEQWEEKGGLLLQTDGEVVNTGACAEEQQNLLLLVTSQKLHKLAELLISVHNLQKYASAQFDLMTVLWPERCEKVMGRTVFHTFNRHRSTRYSHLQENIYIHIRKKRKEKRIAFSNTVTIVHS